MAEKDKDTLLIGRTAVITGAASGIGQALAREAAARGMSLALIDNRESELQGVVEQLSSRTQVRSACLDVRHRAELVDFAAACAADSIALVFANAGLMRAGTSWELSEDDWHQVFDVNVKGVVNTASAFMPQLLAQSSRSRIVMTGSTSAFNASPGLACYSSSKHALWGLAEAMQLELEDINAPVSVSFLAPSGVKTPLASAPVAGAAAPSQKNIDDLLGMFGVPPEDVAKATFAAIMEEHFWILPHPDFKPAMSARLHRIIEEQPPCK